jgi:hypothetical protein
MFNWDAWMPWQYRSHDIIWETHLATSENMEIPAPQSYLCTSPDCKHEPGNGVPILRLLLSAR